MQLNSEMTNRDGEDEALLAGGGRRKVRRHRLNRVLRWVVAILVAILVHGAALILIDLPDEPGPEVVRRLAPVSLLSVDPEGRGRLLKEQLEFSDTAPLYFPTRWNVANAENIRLPLKSPGDIFESYEPRLSYSDVAARGLVDLPTLLIVSPTAALASYQPDFTRVAGRVDRVVMPLEARLAMVEVFDVRGGAKVFETTVSEVADPAALTGPDWQPAEWVVLMDAVGKVGEAMMTRSSGSDSVDDSLQFVVDQQLDLDKQLPPGYYTVLIGP